LAVSSGIGSTTPTTLEAVRRTLQGRQQHGGVPVAIDDLEALERLTLSLGDGNDVEKMEIEEVEGDGSLEEGNDAAIVPGEAEAEGEGEYSVPQYRRKFENR